MTPPPPIPAPLLRMTRIAKRFGTTVALSDVSLEVGPAQVHALVGENGAGKSTLMKILAGAEVADAGEIEMSGRAFAPRRPLDSLRADRIDAISRRPGSAEAIFRGLDAAERAGFAPIKVNCVVMRLHLAVKL